MKIVVKSFSYFLRLIEDNHRIPSESSLSTEEQELGMSCPFKENYLSINLKMKMKCHKLDWT